jgi:ADP-ribosylglycohydrolase
MRCTPLAVYSHLLPSDQLRQTVIKDNNFTHCNPNVIDAVYLYCFTIGKLISSDKSDMKERIEEAINLTSEVCIAECNEDVKQWFDLSRHFAKEGQVLKSLLDPSTNIGFLKHAFVLSYFFLQSLPEKSYA